MMLDVIEEDRGSGATQRARDRGREDVPIYKKESDGRRKLS